jgi:tetratricopeptide (TPR) repeat protein
MPTRFHRARHTYPLPPMVVAHLNRVLVLAVYFRLMIVSITLTSKVPDVLDVVGGGGGSDLPPVGISPAKMEVDSAHISASAIANRFMGIAPSEVLRKCQRVYIKNHGTRRQDFLQGGLERIIIRFAFAQLLRKSKVSILMRTTSPKLDLSHLSPNEQAELRCSTALELKDRNEYDAAREAMFPIWNGRIGSRPNTKGLSDTVTAQVLLTTGILTGWLGSRSEIKEADDYAKDLITESMRLFEELKDSRKVAEARTELAWCYWRTGDNESARIFSYEALNRLTIGGNARANALIILVFAEWAESRHKEVLRILTENAPVFERITNHTFKGTFHNQLGITFRVIGSTSKKRRDYFQLAIAEYHAADEEFKLAKNLVYRADVKNNIAYVLRELRRFKEAHDYLEQARRLFIRLNDKVSTAQVDDSRAQLFIAEGKYAEAKMSAHSAARTFERAGRQCLLAESLMVQGIALARLHEPEHAQFIFQRAIEIAHQAGSLHRAGLAALTMIEEIETLPRDIQSVACEQAREWLASSENPDIRPRLKAARQKIAARHSESQPVDVLFNQSYDLRAEVSKFEHDLIARTLARVNGKVSHAAKLLNIGYQTLAHMIEHKYPDLLTHRTPIRRRPTKKERQKRKSGNV